MTQNVHNRGFNLSRCRCVTKNVGVSLVYRNGNTAFAHRDIWKSEKSRRELKNRNFEPSFLLLPLLKKNKFGVQTNQLIEINKNW